ncbi:PLP-dependent aminotransferase family protein [Aneurinibacillus terranovensis]|uniref:MocR-like pyridoxine biosynthesis transcription factor PdxR n=1 Tax=Aneurinibacillus terranovensis TaxID=278991 RepID=UPI00040AFC07|nr:PLP-dependent aminotransferase family protein [Aneurinibacillus terranovensis]
MFTLHWKPVRTSALPIYKQIADLIKGKIETGEWPVGSKLPTERALAQELGVNRSTVVAAYAELSAEGLIEGKSGRGTVITNNTWTLLAAAPPPDWNAYVHAGAHQPNLPAIREINQAEFIPGIIRLGTGELSPELFPKEKMQSVLRRLIAQIDALGYEEPKGLLRLREQVSRYLLGKGIEASPDSILIVSGSLQALQLISVGLLHRGSTILLEKPSYLYSIHVFQSAGMELYGLPIEQDYQDFLRRLTDVKKLKNAALLYTIPSFHNPTGRVMSEENRRKLLSVCERERLPVIEDDVYGDLWIDTSPPPPLKAYDKTGSVLYTGSLSKTVSAGLRIGWIVGPVPVIDRLADIKMQTDYGSSSLSQWVAAEWLESGVYEEHVQEVRKQLRKRRELALIVLHKYFNDIACWEKSGGGFYIWLKIKADISPEKLFAKALEEGILLNPGNIYDRNDRQHMRISYAYAKPAELEEGLYRLSKIIREIKS